MKITVDIDEKSFRNFFEAFNCATKTHKGNKEKCKEYMKYFLEQYLIYEDVNDISDVMISDFDSGRFR